MMSHGQVKPGTYKLNLASLQVISYASLVTQSWSQARLGNNLRWLVIGALDSYLL